MDKFLNRKPFLDRVADFGRGHAICNGCRDYCGLNTRLNPLVLEAPMKLIDVTQKFKTDEDCLDYIEAMRWPNGEIGCVHCGELGRISKITRETRGKNKRTRLYQCLACEKQFSATSGTIFNDTHLPLSEVVYGDCDGLRSEERYVCATAEAALWA
jgi:Transposase zinc-ribbon domain